MEWLKKIAKAKYEKDDIVILDDKTQGKIEDIRSERVWQKVVYVYDLKILDGPDKGKKLENVNERAIVKKASLHKKAEETDAERASGIIMLALDNFSDGKLKITKKGPQILKVETPDGFKFEINIALIY